MKSGKCQAFFSKNDIKTNKKICLEVLQMQRRIKSIHHQTSYEGGIGGGHVSLLNIEIECASNISTIFYEGRRTPKNILQFFFLWVSIKFQEVLATVA